ncbi:MAG: hypothetical protein PVJ66_01805 [Gammaproteobacteria bacterium]|jgi:hypothetical protein
MAAHKMLLTPTDPDCAPVATGLLAETLQEIGLIGPPIPHSDGLIYPAGDRFLQLVTFLGCSPRIELEPPSSAAALEAASRDGGFCHVRLPAADQGLQFYADERAPPPRCPRCRQPEQHWRALIRSWRERPAAVGWTCTACGYHGLLTELNFRKSAGFGRTFVEIRGIHPAEAVAGEALLARLGALAGCEWRTLYIRK